METRFVTVETDSRVGEYAESRFGEVAKRCWK